jgi:RND family efflux transporter MFP subunit
MNKSIITLFISSLLVACSSGNSSTENTEENPTTETKKISSDTQTEVQVVSLQSKAFLYSVALQGKIEAQAQSELRFRQSGTITQLNIRNGQNISAGQTVAELDKKALELALAKAQNQVDARTSDYQDRLLQQRIDLKDENEISKELRRSFKISSGLVDAEIALKEAQLALSESSLKSPISGIVANLDFKKHQYISPDKALCTVYSSGQLEVVGEVLESEVGQLSIGQKATVEAVIGKQSFEAVLQEINPSVNAKGLVKIRLRLLNTQGLLVGMNVQANIQVPRQQTLIVPKEAIVIRSGKKVVFTVGEDGLAKWNYVETGLENQNEVEITKGLKGGEKVIITNNLQLAHDAPVKVLKEG